MNKVTTINLNGKAYQVEESGYEAIKSYLENAELELRDNPDKTEIMNDMEQAIADKFLSYISSYKNIVLTSEIQTILQEMGPVKEAPIDNSTDEKAKPKHEMKRLYQIREGSMISGICNGLAVYLDLDVTLIRIVFILLAVITGGGFVGVYIIAMFIIPFPKTPEEKSAAYNIPHTAQEVVNRAKENYANLKDTFKDKEWRQERKESSKIFKKELKRTLRENKKRWRQAYYQKENTWASVLKPFINTIVSLIWIAFFVFVYLLIKHNPLETQHFVDVISNAVVQFGDWIKSVSN